MTTPAVVSVWSYDGRSSRSDYFVVLLITSVLGAIAGLMMSQGGALSFFSGVFLLGVLWVSMCACVRRMHDVGHSGWWSLVAFVPLANILFGLYALFAPGQDQENEFGPPTSKPSSLPPVGDEVVKTPRPVASPMTVIAEVPLQNLSPSEMVGVEPMEEFWAQALHECESSAMRAGLWAKAFADASGDDRVAKATYMRLRAMQLQVQYVENQQALKLARDQQFRAEQELQKAQEAEAAELLAKMNEEERAKFLLPHGICPSCDALIPIASQACPHCNALFTVDSNWKIKPLRSIDRRVQMALNDAYEKSKSKEEQEGEATRSLIFGVVILLLLLLIASRV